MLTGEAAALHAALDLLERAIGYTRGALTLVGPQQRHRRTPCAAWNLEALLHHMDDSLLSLLEATEVTYVDLSAPAGPAPLDLLLGRIRARACAVLGGWARHDGASLVSVAGSPLDASLVAAAGALEITVHGWDVAVACGRRQPPPEGLSHELVELVPLFVTESDRPARFAAPVQVRARATAGERLVALTGRCP